MVPDEMFSLFQCLTCSPADSITTEVPSGTDSTEDEIIPCVKNICLKAKLKSRDYFYKSLKRGREITDGGGWSLYPGNK